MSDQNTRMDEAIYPVPTRFFRDLFRTLRNPATLYFALIGNLILLSCVAVFHTVETGANPAVRTWLDSAWWGVTTVTTVGYGDVVPVTTVGRIAGIVLMIAGVSLFVGFTGLVASGLHSRMQDEIKHSERVTFREYQSVMAELARISEQIAKLQPKDTSQDPGLPDSADKPRAV
ncbi:MAG: potassium channel family protein [Verrucomicrobia subdivision 3 bacterium]|nr:potassium channel family protein [Limisphaerales bacterium]